MPRSTGETIGILSRMLSLPGDLAGLMGAGILSSAYNAVKAPGDAYTGKIAPEDMVARGNEFALNMAGGGSMVPRPKGSLGMFGGPNAKTADLRKLKMAEEWEARGINPETIRSGTSWFKGADGQWRFEIPDNNSRMIGDPTKRDWTANQFEHPELYKAYPELRKGSVGPLDQNLVDQGFHAINHGNGSISLGTTKPQRSTMLHELQHGIQNIEGFGKGGVFTDAYPIYQNQLLDKGTKAPYKLAQKVYKMSKGGTDGAVNFKLYKRLAGEVEARNVEKRMDFTPLERAMQSPVKTEDIPRAKQIIFGNK